MHALKRSSGWNRDKFPTLPPQRCFNVKVRASSSPVCLGFGSTLPLRGKKHLACPPTHHQKAKIHIFWAMGRFASILPSVSLISLQCVSKPSPFILIFCGCPSLGSSCGALQPHTVGEDPAAGGENPPNICSHSLTDELQTPHKENALEQAGQHPKK